MELIKLDIHTNFQAPNCTQARLKLILGPALRPTGIRKILQIYAWKTFLRALKGEHTSSGQMSQFFFTAWLPSFYSGGKTGPNMIPYAETLVHRS